MSAAVPDPRFRDQLAEAAIPILGARLAHRVLDALMPTIAAEVEARVQATANQRAAEYAWSEGYEACRRGEQKRNPYRAAALASPAPAPHAEATP